MKNLKKIILYIFSICFIYFLFVTVFYNVLYLDKNFLIKLFDKFDVYKNLPFTLSKTDIEKIAYELMDFLRGKLTFLETTVSINNQITEVYSLNAKIHMGDVRYLFLTHINAHYIALSICILCIIIIYKNNLLKDLFKAYRNVLIICSILILSFIIFAFIDFDLLFTIFHKFSFSNDLYLFNPNVDFIILMLPEDLFAYVAFKIAIIFLIVVTIFLFLFYQVSKIQFHPEAK